MEDQAIPGDIRHTWGYRASHEQDHNTWFLWVLLLQPTMAVGVPMKVGSTTAAGVASNGSRGHLIFTLEGGRRR